MTATSTAGCERDESMIERLANERFRAAQSGTANDPLSRDALTASESRGLFFLTESFRSHPAIMDIYSKTGLLLLKMCAASRAVALALVFLPLVAEADVNGTALSATADELTVEQADPEAAVSLGSLRQRVKALLRQADINGTALAAVDENPVKQAILRQLAKVQVDEILESGEVCWVSRHSLWDCGLECYASSSHEWRPCASKCAKLQHLGARCNYCLSELVHCVLLQCVSPCAVSTHSSSCEGCILGGCNAKCWNPHNIHHVMLIIPPLLLLTAVFYSSQLEHREREVQQRLMPFFDLQGCSSPVIMHNVQGTERCDADSASFYNLDEVKIVQRYVLKLLAVADVELEPKDIGIITPYARQVQMLQEQLNACGRDLSEVEIGTVEHFQGQERAVIILSAVRSSTRTQEQLLAMGFPRVCKRLSPLKAEAEAKYVGFYIQRERGRGGEGERGRGREGASIVFTLSFWS
eukprot:s1337_g6.t1